LKTSEAVKGVSTSGDKTYVEILSGNYEFTSIIANR